MSVKIYNARRLKRGEKLWPFAVSVQERAVKNIKKELTSWYLRMLRDAEDPGQRKHFLKLLELPSNYTRPLDAFAFSNWINREVRAQAGRGISSAFDMDVSVVFHEYRGRIYFRHFATGMMGHTLNFLHRDPRSEDFHYQDQVDKSSDCSNAAWKRRAKIWGSLMDPWGRLTTGLVLEILCSSTFFTLDYEVREALPQKRRTP